MYSLKTNVIHSVKTHCRKLKSAGKQEQSVRMLELSGIQWFSEMNRLFSLNFLMILMTSKQESELLL